MSKFPCSCRSAAVIKSRQNEVPNMARFERRGYGANRSPGHSIKASATPLIRCALTLLCFLVLTITTNAQDVNVHIEPKPTAPPKTADTKEDVGNADHGLKNHAKPGLAVD